MSKGLQAGHPVLSALDGHDVNQYPVVEVQKENVWHITGGSKKIEND
jgi:hypothetical protein